MASSCASASLPSESRPSSETQSEVTTKRKSNDVGWEYGMLVDASNLDKIKCKFCGKLMSGGVYRLKAHIGGLKGNVKPCHLASPDAKSKCLNAINEAKSKKMNISNYRDELAKSVDIMGLETEDELRESLGSKPPRSLGPMDTFASEINPEASLNVAKTSREQNIKDALWKERSLSVKNYFADWVYEAGIPFNTCDLDSFRLFTEALGQFGPKWKPPSQYELREPLLKHAVERTRKKVKPNESEWEMSGCSLMTDAWSDRKRRSIMNLCVNSKSGTIFLSSKESSDVAHTSEMIFNYVDECIELIGPEKVVQVVTDNASNNMGAAKLLRLKRPNIFWTSCATHTINLVLEGIAKLTRFKKFIDQAKALTIFIYAHHKNLAMMRLYTKRRDIVRPGVTRFASSFLSLQSLVEKKVQLKAMFCSSEWDECKWSKSVKGQACYNTVMSIAFWNGVTSCLTVFAPLVRVLRLVDGDRKPAMGFLHGEIIRVKDEIKMALNSYSKNYDPILEIMDGKIKDRLDTPLHLMAYLLNPYYFYKDPNIELDHDVSNGVIECLETICHGNFDLMNDIMNVELPKYKSKEGAFGKPIAARGCEVNDNKYDPATWWKNYGYGTPNLQRIAIRILSLTTSSSGCERCWSAFEGVHTKKRNRLDVSRLNNLIYVQFNNHLLNKRKKGLEKDVDVLLASDASKAQEWIIPGCESEDENELNDNEVDADASTVRELEEEDFYSEHEVEVNENEVDFESDEERVVEIYGQEEEDPLNIV